MSTTTLAQPATDAERIEAIRGAFPAEGLFAEKAWRLSPKPFSLAPATVRKLQQLGPRLQRFQRAANENYFRSRKGSLPRWIAEVLDQGKPKELLEIATEGRTRDLLPRVIRPDLVLTEDGFALTELDSVPGGIGLTAWLGHTYADLNPDSELVGGRDGMVRGFSSVLDGNTGADILVSEESADYRPEMEWLAPQLAGDWKVHGAESYQPNSRSVYRFFELFDLDNLPSALSLGKAAAAGEIDLTAPFKPFLEEKLWSAIFWMRPLRETWRRELRDSHWQRLQEIIPYSWVLNPEALPPHAAIPRLEINDFTELKQFSQQERDLVLKISGFSELGWGSRSVTIGSDSSQEEWSAAVENALDQFGTHPYVLQEFHKGRRVEHPFWNDDTGAMETLEGRVRLCPYYFVDAAKPTQISLGGVLATICPADKKILHGMKDAILVPCSISEDGY